MTDTAPETPLMWSELDPSTVEPMSVGIVWGNCQAESMRRLVAPAGALRRVEFLALPPVFEMDDVEVARLHQLMPRVAILVTQPVKDEYRVAGCGSEQLVGLMDPAAQVVRVPTTYYEGLFPWQVHAHDDTGLRVDAPLTDYHDLRLIDAAARGLSVEQAVERLRSFHPDPAGIRSVAAASEAELRRRNADLDVDTTDAVIAGGSKAMWTVNHPANSVMRSVACGVFAALGWPNDPPDPDYQMLGQTKAPLDTDVLSALNLPMGDARTEWWLRDREVAWEEVAAAHWELYSNRPEIATTTRDRYADRAATLGLW